MLVYYVVGFAVVGIFILDQFVRGRSVKVLKVGRHPATGTESVVTSAGHSAYRQTSLAVSLLVMVLLVVFSGLRYGIGTDYVLYQMLFANIDENSFWNSVRLVPQDIGYVFLSYVLKNFSVNPYILFWTSSVLTLVPLFIAIRRQSVNHAESLFVYYFLGLYVLSFNAIRQSISVSLVLLADTYRDESKWKWLLLNLVATLIHISALVIFVIQLVAVLWKPTRKSLITVLTLSGLSASILLNNDLVHELAGSLNQRYLTHLSTDDGAGIGTLLTLLFRLVLVFVLIDSVRTKSQRRHLAYVAVSTLVLAVAFSNSLVGRFDSYLSVFLVLLVPNALANAEGKTLKKTLVFGALLLYLGFYAYNYNEVTPYTLVPGLR